MHDQYDGISHPPKRVVQDTVALKQRIEDAKTQANRYANEPGRAGELMRTVAGDRVRAKQDTLNAARRGSTTVQSRAPTAFPDRPAGPSVGSKVAGFARASRAERGDMIENTMRGWAGAPPRKKKGG